MRIIRGGLPLLVLLALVTACSSGGGAARPTARTAAAVTVHTTPRAAASQPPLALVYRGPAACEGCAEAARDMLVPLGFTVRFVGPAERLHFGPTALHGAALYVQPGGANGLEVDTAWDEMQQDPGFQPDALRDFVRGGGRYLGLCMGAYLAGNPGLGLLAPGDSGQEIARPGAEVTTTDDSIVTVSWRGTTRRMYFQDGPYFRLDTRRDGISVVARYRNGDIAAALVPYGSGRVAVVGPHPEAPSAWYDDYGLPDLSQTDADLGPDFVHALMA